MANILIYLGLSVLILASLIALVAAIRGWRLSQRMNDSLFIKKSLTKYTMPALYLTIIGFILVGIGIAITLI